MKILIFFNKLSEINNEFLRKYCNDLEIILKNGDRKDVNALELYEELCAFRDTFQRNDFNIPILIFLIILYSII